MKGDTGSKLLPIDSSSNCEHFQYLRRAHRDLRARVRAGQGNVRGARALCREAREPRENYRKTPKFDCESPPTIFNAITLHNLELSAKTHLFLAFLISRQNCLILNSGIPGT